MVQVPLARSLCTWLRGRPYQRGGVCAHLHVMVVVTERFWPTSSQQLARPFNNPHLTVPKPLQSGSSRELVKVR